MTATPRPTRPAPYRHAGFWLALAIALLMFANAARTWLDPAAFSTYMGLPSQDPMALAWVRVYGLRALFTGLTVAFLLRRIDPGALKWLCIFGLPLALGDAWLVSTAGVSAPMRHLVIAAVLAISAFALWRWERTLR